MHFDIEVGSVIFPQTEKFAKIQQTEGNFGNINSYKDDVYTHTYGELCRQWVD